tara:strand:+ start:237 stop:932 length:696 start_codon:yes stop_codon:yes gene_type:complete
LLTLFNNNYFFSLAIGQSFNFIEALVFAFGKSTDIIALLFSSILIRLILEKAGQTWIRTFSQTSTLIILPIITYIITSVISGNIALSLGMVGALSIVRFRNPVRSPFQLSVYFGVITMGIATSTNINWLILILFATILIAFFIKIYSITYKYIFNKELFNTSFVEGNNLSTLEISAKNNIQILDNSLLLKSKSGISKTCNYLFASNDFNQLKRLLFEVEKNEDLISYQLNE